MEGKRILITGSAGFIGFHLSKLLLEEGYRVHGYDGLTEYYDVTLKKQRHKILSKFPNFSNTVGMLEDQSLLDNDFDSFKPEVIVHLAAQAGVRYSLENPRAYIDANVVGTFNVMEAARRNEISHLLIISMTSGFEPITLQSTIYSDTSSSSLNSFLFSRLILSFRLMI